MDQIRSLSQLLEYAKKIGAEKGPKKLSVAMAEEAGLLSAIEEARQAGFAEAILVGNADKIKAAADQAGVNLANYEVIDERNEPAMGMTAVSQVSSGKADIYMKGQIHTNNFLRAMLNKEVGLRKGRTPSPTATSTALKDTTGSSSCPTPPSTCTPIWLPRPTSPRTR